MELSQNGRSSGAHPVARADIARGRWNLMSDSRVAATLLPLSLALAWLAARQVDLARLTDLGLISVLPPELFAATALLSLSFALVLRRSYPNSRLALLHLVALIAVLYGIAPLLEHNVPRFGATYKHVGIVDYIVRTGRVDPGIDAYFNWPAFFIFSAFVRQAAGLHDILPVIQWAPVVYNLMYLAPLAAIARSATADRRLVWLSIWFFYMMNWVGQDYYSPQGMAYFLYLVAIAIALTWFRSPTRWPSPVHRALGALPVPRGRGGALRSWLAGWAAPPEAPSAAATPVQRTALMIILVVVILGVVAIHQLTPFALLAVLSALAIFNRSSLRTMPILVFAATVAWIVFMANTYLEGHISQVTGHVFQLGSTVNQNVGSRLAGSAAHVLVVHAALLTTAAIFLLACLGALRSIHHGYRDLTYVLLIAAPFGLLALQSYEGEGLLRVYLYALPGVVFFAAALFFTTPTRGRSWRATAALLLVSQILIGAFYLCRYGNERMDYFSGAELQAVDRLYAIAPPGSVLMAAADNLPWRSQGYELYTYASADDPQGPVYRPLSQGDVSAGVHQIESSLSDPRYADGYIVFMPAESAYAEMFGVYPRGTYARLQRAIAGSREFRLVYHNRQAAIYTLRGTTRGVG